MSVSNGTIQESNWDIVLNKIEEKQKSLQDSKLTKYMLQGKTYGCSIGYTYQNYPLHQFHYDHYSYCINYTCRLGSESIWGTRKLYSEGEIIKFIDEEFITYFQNFAKSQPSTSEAPMTWAKMECALDKIFLAAQNC